MFGLSPFDVVALVWFLAAWLGFGVVVDMTHLAGPSLSRLMKDGIGKDFTREDHPRVASQLYASYARALEARNLASIIGAEELSERDRRYLKFAEAFEKRFVGQGEDDDRSIEETLNLAWDLLSFLPPDALARVSEADIKKYHKWEANAA